MKTLIHKYQKPELYLSRVCTYYKVDREDIMLRKRDCQRVIRARHALAYLLRYHSLLTLKEIGEYIGKRDHSTVINSVNQINNRTHPGIEEEVEKLRYMSLADPTIEQDHIQELIKAYSPEEAAKKICQYIKVVNYSPTDYKWDVASLKS